MLTLIVARARDGAIGKNGDIPWRLPEDLRFFKRETLGGAVIMGRKTWDSLPFKPLKDRLNLVVSRDSGLAEHVFATPHQAVNHARAQGHARVYGIGGQSIYQALLPHADRLLVTEVDTDVPDADAHFPAFAAETWAEVWRMPFASDAPKAELVEYLRRV